MAKGNPEPSPETRFGAKNGNKPNGGKTSEQRRLEYEAALMSAEIRHAMLSSIKEKLQDGSDILDYMRGDTLKLFKDSEDRAHGTPKQSVDNTSSDGSMTPTKIIRELVTPKETKETP
jgi:hypothetical protein